MRSKLMLWGAAAAIALTSTAVMANVVIVKSLGPSAKAYPPGKTLSESAKITLQGGDIVTVLGPASAQTLRGPGNFDAKQVTLASAAAKRGARAALRQRRLEARLRLAASRAPRRRQLPQAAQCGPSHFSFDVLPPVSCQQVKRCRRAVTWEISSGRWVTCPVSPGTAAEGEPDQISHLAGQDRRAVPWVGGAIPPDPRLRVHTSSSSGNLRLLLAWNRKEGPFVRARYMGCAQCGGPPKVAWTREAAAR